MPKTPFMPLWVADFTGDTLDLSAQEIGAYMLLLMAMWGRDGYLPNDHKKLQRVARCGREWPRIWAAIGHYFTVEGDRITQGRLRDEYAKVAAKRGVNAHSGALGGRAKALKYNKATLANANVSPYQPEPEPYSKNKNKDAYASLSVPPEPPPEDAGKVADAVKAYNAAAERAGWPRAQRMTKPRAAAIRARLAECGGIAGWEVAMRKALDSDFLCARTARPWTGCNLDWLAKAANFTKLMEGNYDNRTGTAPPARSEAAERAARVAARFEAGRNNVACDQG